MVEKGWDHAALCKMAEEEFRWWLERRHELDELIAEATEDAARTRGPQG